MSIEESILCSNTGPIDDYGEGSSHRQRYGIIGSSLRADAPAYQSPIISHSQYPVHPTTFPAVVRSYESHDMREYSERPMILPSSKMIIHPKLSSSSVFDQTGLDMPSYSTSESNRAVMIRSREMEMQRNDGYPSSAEMSHNLNHQGHRHTAKHNESILQSPSRQHRDSTARNSYDSPQRSVHINDARYMTPPSQMNMRMMIPAPLSIPRYDMDPYVYPPQPTPPHNIHRHHYPLHAVVSAPTTPRKGSNSRDSRPSGTHLQELESSDGCVYQVHFKRAHRNFLLSHGAPRNIKPGDFVKVEADRGEDMGVVVSKVPAKDFEEFVPTAGYRGRGFSSGQGEKKFIYRFATSEEKSQLKSKVRDEEKTLQVRNVGFHCPKTRISPPTYETFLALYRDCQVIREKVLERQMPMAILDAEYQFDRHKLVFFFEADRRIDFRELVSDLFSLYKTRIWMQQVDTSVLPDHEIRMEIARAAGFLPSSYSPRDMETYVEDDLTDVQASSAHHLSIGFSPNAGMRSPSHASSLLSPHVQSPSMAGLRDRPVLSFSTDLSANQLHLQFDPSEPDDISLSSPHSPAELARELAEQTFSEQSYPLPAFDRQQNRTVPDQSFPVPQFDGFGYAEFGDASDSFFASSSGNAELPGSMGPLLEGSWAYSADGGR